MKQRYIYLALAAGFTISTVDAQPGHTIYRCVQDGKVAYSDHPCVNTSKDEATGHKIPGLREDTSQHCNQKPAARPPPSPGSNDANSAGHASHARGANREEKGCIVQDSKNEQVGMKLIYQPLSQYSA
jgi:hypothetical protein